MTFWTYMLHCADDSYYVRQTSDLDRRIARHRSGEIAGYRRERRPVLLVWSDSFQTRAEAREAEHRIKPSSGAKRLALIAGDRGAPSVVAIPPGESAVRASATQGGAARLHSGNG